MKYYSEKLKKVYDTVEQLDTAEKEYDEAHAAEIAKQKERKARAEEISNARKDAIKAQEHYDELIKQFVKDYGSYHATYTDENSGELSNVMDVFYKLFGF